MKSRNYHIKWNGSHLDVTAYVDGDHIEIEHIKMFDEKGNELGIFEAFGNLTAINSQGHAKDPLYEIEVLILDSIAEDAYERRYERIDGL